MPNQTRRGFLKTSALTTGALTAGGLLTRPLLAQLSPNSRPEPIPPIQDPRIKALVERALDAARGAGASYADVRLTYSYGSGIRDQFHLFNSYKGYLHVGVRALAKGYWGFASGALWHPDEMVRLGREAAQQASVNSLGQVSEVTLAPVPVVRDGHWEMPMEIDPTTVSEEEGKDIMNGLKDRMLDDFYGQGLISRRVQTERYGTNQISFAVSYYYWTQDRVFGSSEGSYCTQRRCISQIFSVAARDSFVFLHMSPLEGKGFERMLTWDAYKHAGAEQQARQEMLQLPAKELDVGRYRVVMDATSAGRLLSRTIGKATQLDRALGYEANASGTSFLDDPATMLGTYQLGSPLLTVHGNRSEVGGCATMKWDDEGVEPVEFPLIQQGVLQDYQTSREGAGWLQEAYAKLGRPLRSNGCAYASLARDVALIHTPNLVMAPGKDGVGVRELEEEIGDGVSIVEMQPDVIDQQLRGGTCKMSYLFEIKNGKRVAQLGGIGRPQGLTVAGVQFQTTQLLKNILAVGGRESLVRDSDHGILQTITDWDDDATGKHWAKGEPVQQGFHSITAAPIAVKDVDIINNEAR